MDVEDGVWTKHFNRRVCKLSFAWKLLLFVQPGDKVRVFRESDNCYIGPYPVIRVDDKQVFLLDGNKEKQFSIHQVIPENNFESIKNGEFLMETMYNMIHQFKSSNTKERRKSKTPAHVHITEVLHPKDARYSGKEAKEAKRKEIENLIRRGTWELIIEEEVPKTQT